MQASADVQQHYRALQRTFARIAAVEVEDPVDNRKLYPQLPGMLTARRPVLRNLWLGLALTSCPSFGLASTALFSLIYYPLALLHWHDIRCLSP